MTTPSSNRLKVIGVLVDPVLLCQQIVSSSETIHATVQSLWKIISERVDGNPTSQPPESPAIQVVLGEIGLFTPFLKS